jgi:hypothetical protein
MNKDIISKKTRNEFREFFVSYYLRQIEEEFDAADIQCDENFNPNLSGARRSKVEQYYHSINWLKGEDIRKILVVYENTLQTLDNHASDSEDKESAQNNFKSLVKWLEKDGFTYSKGRIIHAGHHASLKDVSMVTDHLNSKEIQFQIDRMRNAAESDPSLAIGTAKELIESICKTILKDLGITFTKDDNIIELLKKTRKELGIVPDEIPETAKGAKIIKKLLNNLATIAQNLGELRNLYGTGHGRDGKMRGLTPRHARLAVGSASTLVTFLYETYLEKKKT